MTAREIITAALQCIGVPALVDPNNNTLAALNRILDSWDASGLYVYSVQVYQHTLTVGQRSYTIGQGGQINIQRPVKIQDAACISGGARFPVAVADSERWNRLIRVDDMTSSVILALYNDYAYPISTIRVWPTPSMASTLELHVWTQLGKFSTLDSNVSFPPGYDRALIYQLAANLAPSFGRVIGQDLAALVEDSKAMLIASNKALPGALPVPAKVEAQAQ